jgi:hypothetical protein
MLAIRQAGATTVPSGTAADIEQVVHRVDPDLAISSTTNHGVVRYRVALRDWAQREQIYGALEGVQKLGVSSTKDPPYVMVSVDERSLALLPPMAVPSQPVPAADSSAWEFPRLPGGIHDLPAEVAVTPQPKWIPLAVSGVFVLCFAGVFGVWRLLGHPKAMNKPVHSAQTGEPADLLKTWVGRSKDSSPQ